MSATTQTKAPNQPRPRRRARRQACRYQLTAAAAASHEPILCSYPVLLRTFERLMNIRSARSRSIHNNRLACSTASLSALAAMASRSISAPGRACPSLPSHWPPGRHTFAKHCGGSPVPKAEKARAERGRRCEPITSARAATGFGPLKAASMAVVIEDEHTNSGQRFLWRRSRRSLSILPIRRAIEEP